MGAKGSFAKLDQDVFVTLNDTLTSGVTKADASKPISELLDFFVDGREATVYLRVNTLSRASASSAALGFGEHIFSYPAGLGLVQPIYSSIRLESRTGTGQSATAGEVGLGSTIASGAVATLGGTTAFENIMEGTTIANHVALTTLVSKEANAPVAYGDHGAAGLFGVLDATASEVKAHLNLATTYGGATTVATTFSATIVHRFRVLSSDFGVL